MVQPSLPDCARLRNRADEHAIYLDQESLDLFAYVEVDDEDRWNRIAATDVCRRWWQFMRDIMPSNRDSSPVSRDLREVFHVERGGCARWEDQGAGGAPVPCTSPGTKSIPAVG